MEHNSDEDHLSEQHAHRHRQLPSGLLTMVNTTLVGIGGVFMATSSVPVTGIAAGTVALVALILVFCRR